MFHFSALVKHLLIVVVAVSADAIAAVDMAVVVAVDVTGAAVGNYCCCCR